MPKRTCLAIPLALALLIPGDVCAEWRLEERLAPGQPPVIVAHRSATLGEAPENSLAWIAAAIDLGLDMVHVNPQLTADGGYVLMHDQTLNRTTNVEQVYPDGPPGGPTRAQRGGQDYLRDYTVAEIANLRLVHGADVTEQRVPTLQEALDLVDGRIGILLGLKAYEVESLAAAISGTDKSNLLLMELCYPGTDQSKLRQAAEATGLGVSATLFRSRDYAADLDWLLGELGSSLAMVGVGSRRLTPEFLSRTRDLGLPVLLSGWNGPEDSALVGQGDPGPWMAALDQGFPALTDRPDLLLEALGR